MGYNNEDQVSIGEGSVEEDGTESASNEISEQMEVNCLRPTKLMVLAVTVGKSEVSALVDSGATRSLIRRQHVSSDQFLPAADVKEIMGLGNNRLEVIGNAETTISLVDREFPGRFLVVGDQDIQYDLILGIDFLKENKVKLDLSRDTLTIGMSDGSSVIASVNDGGEIASVMWERVPVYCSERIRVKNGKLDAVPIRFQCNFGFDEDTLLYFEPKGSDVLGGVLKPDQKFAITDENKMNWNIQEGQVLGHVYTVLVADKEEDERDPETWSPEQIQGMVKLGDNLTEDQKKRVRKLLLDYSQALSKGDADIGCANVEPHRIGVTNETPIWQRPRHFSQPVNEEIDRQCAELLASDILEYSDSNWSSPVVPVKNRTIAFDYA